MTKLAELKRDLARALEDGEQERVGSVRRLIATQYEETEDGVEACYKLGLDALFVRQDLEEAEKRFRAAVRAKSETWSASARVSLALVLLALGKSQQAVFELRKVARKEPPDILSAQAWGILEMSLRDLKNGEEAKRARHEHLKLLKRLATDESSEDAALAHFMLGMEYKHDGVRKEARQHLETALSNDALPPVERTRAEQAIKDL